MRKRWPARAESSDAGLVRPGTSVFVRRGVCTDGQAHGCYCTKERILEIYDATQHAIDNGAPSRTFLDQPLTDPDVVHLVRERGTTERGKQ